MKNYDQKYIMECNGMFCVLNMPPALKSRMNEEDLVADEMPNALPPYKPVRPYSVDEFPACPSHWMKSSDKVRSYFVPIADKNGLWLDFNENLKNTHHVAVVISIQGVNPITGMPCGEHLEQYTNKCPKHNIKFGADRFCSKCGYKWPKQNYICTNATPHGEFWLDGFRSIDGIVRQYILTQEKARGIAKNIIGEQRVYSIGLNFFLSKNKKKIYKDSRLGFYSPVHVPVDWQIPNSISVSFDSNLKGLLTKGGSTKCCLKNYQSTDSVNCFYNSSEIADNDYSLNAPMPCASAPGAASAENDSCAGKSFKAMRQRAGGASCSCGSSRAVNAVRSVDVKQLEVGAGAKIRQMVHDDPENLSFWQDNSEAMICINYALIDDARRIIESGRNASCSEGFMSNMIIGQ